MAPRAPIAAMGSHSHRSPNIPDSLQLPDHSQFDHQEQDDSATEIEYSSPTRTTPVSTVRTQPFPVFQDQNTRMPPSGLFGGNIQREDTARSQDLSRPQARIFPEAMRTRRVVSGFPTEREHTPRARRPSLKAAENAALESPVIATSANRDKARTRASSRSGPIDNSTRPVSTTPRTETSTHHQDAPSNRGRGSTRKAPASQPRSSTKATPKKSVLSIFGIPLSHTPPASQTGQSSVERTTRSGRISREPNRELGPVIRNPYAFLPDLTNDDYVEQNLATKYTGPPLKWCHSPGIIEGPSYATTKDGRVWNTPRGIFGVRFLIRDSSAPFRTIAPEYRFISPILAESFARPNLERIFWRMYAERFPMELVGEKDIKPPHRWSRDYKDKFYLDFRLGFGDLITVAIVGRLEPAQAGDGDALELEVFDYRTLGSKIRVPGVNNRDVISTIVDDEHENFVIVDRHIRDLDANTILQGMEL